MRLGVKVLLPQLLTLALLVAASAALLLDLARQQQTLRSTRQQMEAASQFAWRVTALHSAIVVQVLSYRVDARPRRLQTIAASDEQIGVALDDYLPSIGDARERQLVSAISDARKQVTLSRAEFLRAIDGGSEVRIHAAFDRWRILRELLEASLKDLSVYGANRYQQSAEAVEQQRLALARHALYGVGAAIALTLAGFAYLRATLTRPLAALSARIEAFGRGQLDARAAPLLETKHDEIGQLARTFNQMAAQLQVSSRSLEQRVSERTAQLEAANKELDAFAYSVAHDLRGPLRAIDGFSQAVVEDCADRLDAESSSNLQRVRAASQRMGTLIDDLLRLSRLTRADMSIGEVNLSELAQAAAAELRQTAPERQVEFAVAPGVAARGDAQLLAIAVRNLVANAWKFTAARDVARIEFSAERTAGELVCCVHDNGVGFDMAHVGKLFAPFERLHRTNEFPGTGIGLATVKRIVSRHGGRVWAEGVVDCGATICFTLPLAATGASA